jgi:hypothetical protein
MQKVVGSNPISRFKGTSAWGFDRTRQTDGIPLHKAIGAA